MASQATPQSSDKRKNNSNDNEFQVKKKKKVKSVAIIDSDEEKGTDTLFDFNFSTTHGLHTYKEALNELALKYTDKSFDELDETNIIMYHPSDYSSGEEENDQHIESMSYKPLTAAKDFIDDEARESMDPSHTRADQNDKQVEANDDDDDDDDDDAHNSPDNNNEEADEDCEDDDDDGDEPEEEEAEDEQVKNEQPPDCPVCGNQYKSYLAEEKDGHKWTKYWCDCPLPWWSEHTQLESHMILKNNLLKKFKFPKGKIPTCKRHDYPGKLYIYNAYQKSADKAANDPMYAQKQLLDKRLFFICGAPQKITDEYKPKGKCDWVKSADCIDLEAAKLEEMYKQIIIETRKAKKQGNRSFHWNLEQQEKKFKADMRARKVRMKREIEKMEKKPKKKAAAKKKSD